MPAGNPDGGQWTDAGGGSGTEIDDSRVRVAQAAGEGSGYPINILEEDASGGHTFERHVGKTEEYLKARVLENRVNIPHLNWSGGEARAGSFPSLETANKLVNATLSDPINREKVNAFARGDFWYSLPVLQLFKTFEQPTGYEAYARANRQPVIRPTYSVRVRLWRSSSVSRGYYINSA